MREIPIFAVCRGLQLLNVALGGTLHQHLPYDYWNRHWKRETETFPALSHAVRLEEEGILHRLIKRLFIDVNSYHHQGVATLGKGFNVEARTEDQLVEAFSCETRRLLAVQWHPEGDFSRTEYGAAIEFWLGEWV